MRKNKFQIFCPVVFAILISAQVCISFGWEYDLFKIPYWVYLTGIYLRATSSIACLFLGFYAVVFKIKSGYSLITIGLLFGFLSVAPPVMALYFSKDIDMSVLGGNDLQTFKQTIRLQKLYLLFIGTIFIVTAAAFLVAIRRHDIT